MVLLDKTDMFEHVAVRISGLHESRARKSRAVAQGKDITLTRHDTLLVEGLRKAGFSE